MKFKKGDKVELTQEVLGTLNTKKGDKCVIIDTHKGILYETKNLKTGDIFFTDDSDLKLQVIAKDVKFKVGDPVMVTEYIGALGVEVGDSAVIDSVGNGSYVIKMDKDGSYWLADDDYLKGMKVVPPIPKAETSHNDMEYRFGENAFFIRHNGVTIAIPNGTPIGISICHKDDEYNMEVGESLAFSRMSKLEKEMKHNGR